MSIFTKLSRRLPPATEAILNRIDNLMDEQRRVLEELREQLAEAEEDDHGA